MGVIELESCYVEGLKALGDQLRVCWLDETVNLWGCLFEDEGPEMGDLGNKVGALLIERSMQSFSFADLKVLVLSV